MLKNYRELIVWQKSYQLCIEIYRITKDFPKEEKFGLTSQSEKGGGLSSVQHSRRIWKKNNARIYSRSLYSLWLAL